MYNLKHMNHGSYVPGRLLDAETMFHPKDILFFWLFLSGEF